MKTRERRVLGPADHPCVLCGKTDVVVIESRKVRHLRDRLNPSWDPHVRVTEACGTCGARSFVVRDNVVQAV
ncbi:hypothetical protein [Blastococcus sp. SYSU D01042]